VKERTYEKAMSTFQGTGISITSEGKRHLGAALGTPSFVTSFVEQQVTSWIKELQQLPDISVTHPQTVYAAFTHGFISKWNFPMRCIPDIQPFLSSLEETIRCRSLPNLTSQPYISDTERCLFTLLTRLGVIDPVSYSLFQFAASIKVCTYLVSFLFS